MKGNASTDSAEILPLFLESLVPLPQYKRLPPSAPKESAKQAIVILFAMMAVAQLLDSVKQMEQNVLLINVIVDNVQLVTVLLDHLFLMFLALSLNNKKLQLDVLKGNVKQENAYQSVKELVAIMENVRLLILPALPPLVFEVHVKVDNAKTLFLYLLVPLAN